jgi:GMP synthase (glutamine-hydrolysing)
VRLAHGDYDRWFLRALAPTGAAIHVVDVHAGAPLPSRGGGVDAIIATGSPLSVCDRSPWMIRAGDWLRQQADRGIPVLGVCFGHQLLADAHGGEVARSPLGREVGTVRCTLTRAGREDPLFDGVPADFEVQATHEDEVRTLPRGAELLATNAWSRVQAFRIGSNVRAVQFHPEMDGAATAAVAAARAPAVAADAASRGGDPVGRVRSVLAGIRGTPWGPRILRNFIEQFAAPRAARSRRPPRERRAR